MENTTTTDLRAEAARLYGDGVPVEVIVKETGFSVRTLTRIAKEHGVKRNTAQGSRPVKRDRNLAQVLALNEQGMTVDQIAMELAEKVNSQTIAGWLRDQGRSARYSTNAPGRKRDVRRERVLDRVRSGHAVSDIVKEEGVDKSNVYRWIKQAGLQPGAQAREVNARSVERRREAVMLFNDGVPLDEIRKTLHCDYYLLRELLEDAGVLLQNVQQETLDGNECPCGKMTGTMSAKFCSPECRSKYGAKRQPDPVNNVTFNCETCGKEVTRYKKYGNGANRFCSNKCATKHTKKVRHYVVRESDMVLDSSWEMLFAGIAGFLKVPILRMDRTMAIEWSPGHWYSPDFYLPTIDVHVEVKGQEDPEDTVKWQAFRATGHRLLVVNQNLMDRMRRAGQEEFLSLARIYAM